MSSVCIKLYSYRGINIRNYDQGIFTLNSFTHFHRIHTKIRADKLGHAECVKFNTQNSSKCVILQVLETLVIYFSNKMFQH